MIFNFYARQDIDKLKTFPKLQVLFVILDLFLLFKNKSSVIAFFWTDLNGAEDAIFFSLRCDIPCLSNK